MQYMGSKNRFAKEIIPFFEKREYHVEPFVGGANMIDKITGNRIGCDTHFYLIELLKAIRDGWVPPDKVTEEEYKFAKDNEIEPYLKGFIGFGCSFGSKWFGGFARGNDSNGIPRNFADETRRNLLKQAPNLRGVDFKCCSYDELAIPKKSNIYCDPPYRGATKYKTVPFDYQKFYNWCREKRDEGHAIFISEYEMPDDFRCIWSKSVNLHLDANRVKASQRVERLFTIG